MAVNATATLNEYINQILDQLGLGSLAGFESIIIAAFIIIASFIAAKLIYMVIERYFTRIAKKTKSKVDDEILAALKKPIYYIIILIGFEVAIGSLLISSPYWQGIFGKIITVILILISAWIIARIVSIILENVGLKLAGKTESTLDDEAIPFLSKVIAAVIYVIAFVISLGEFDINITPIIASLGIVGFAVGYGAKDVIANILAGFFILIDRPFIRGERIMIKSNEGTVVDIGLRTTRIKTPTNELLMIPNSSIVTEIVTNYILPEPMRILKLDFGVAYGSDINRVKEIILEVANKSDGILKDPKPEVYFLEMGDFSLNFKLICSLPTFASFGVRDEVNSEIYRKFNEEGIEIPFPVRTVYLKTEEN